MVSMEELIEIEQGIYGTGLICPARVSPILVVHPFCDYMRGFDERFEALVRECPAPIITLETEKAFVQTGNRMLSWKGSLGGMFFVKTKPVDPDPLEISWETLFTFLHRFESSSFDLVGGYTPTSSGPGCLGYTRKLLEDQGFHTTYLPGLTFNCLVSMGR